MDIPYKLEYRPVLGQGDAPYAVYTPSGAAVRIGWAEEQLLKHIAELDAENERLRALLAAAGVMA